MAMAIVIILVSLTVTQYDSMSATAQEQTARSDLDTLRTEIMRHQMERRAAYTVTAPPRDKEGHERHDPWGQPYRVDPVTHQVYSFGPDGTDQRGEGDDVALRFDAYEALELRPPAGVKVREFGTDWAELAWSPVGYKGGVLGYQVFRRESSSHSDVTTTPLNPELIPPSEDPKFRDEGLESGKVYYYAVEVQAKDGTRMRSTGVTGFTIPMEASPRISVSPSSVTVQTNHTQSFTVSAAGFGSPLTSIRFDGDSYNVAEGEKTLVVTRKWAIKGVYTLTAEARDERNRQSSVTIQVEVKDPAAR